MLKYLTHGEFMPKEMTWEDAINYNSILMEAVEKISNATYLDGEWMQKQAQDALTELLKNKGQR